MLKENAGGEVAAQSNSAIDDGFLGEVEFLKVVSQVIHRDKASMREMRLMVLVGGSNI